MNSYILNVIDSTGQETRTVFPEDQCEKAHEAAREAARNSDHVTLAYAGRIIWQSEERISYEG